VKSPKIRIKEHKMELKDKVAIVTGAGKGIGLEICKQFVAQGAVVLLNDIDKSLCLTEAKKLGENCIPVPGDAGDIDFIDYMVNRAVNDFSRLDIVIANAGITSFGDFSTYSPNNFNELMQLNLAGSFFLTQKASTQMKKQAEGGSIVLMSSVTGLRAFKDLSAYGMSKAALSMLAKSLVLEFKGFPININAIAPGATLTERTLENPDYNSSWSQLIPRGRAATVQDIANTVLFLVSEKAKYITGQTLTVDGGLTVTCPQPDKA
jgi:3-oxoacyl-[acyl-carrier protein] reductase